MADDNASGLIWQTLTETVHMLNTTSGSRGGIGATNIGYKPSSAMNVSSKSNCVEDMYLASISWRSVVCQVAAD